MAVKIRLRKVGANNDMSFRLVAVESRCPRDGRYLELLGWYDPKKAGKNFELKMDRIEYWKSKGAKLSDTAVSLVKRSKRGK